MTDYECKHCGKEFDDWNTWSKHENEVHNYEPQNLFEKWRK